MILRRFRKPPPTSGALTFSATFDLPRDEVFRLLRDELEAIGPYIPEITSVTCVERVEDGPRTSLVNAWRADAATIPLVARPFLPRSLLTWTDRNAWDASDSTCRWTFDAPGPFAAAVDCSGLNRYEELPGGRCRLVSEGRLHIDLARVPGIPRVFHGAGRDVEAFLAKLVSPNLSRIADGLRAYLRASG